jgi:hypothetical protein
MIGTTPILGRCLAASLTHVRHQYACVTSESARLFANPTWSVAR